MKQGIYFFEFHTLSRFKGGGGKSWSESTVNTYNIPRSFIRIKQNLPSRLRQIRFYIAPSIIRHKVIRIMVQQFYSVLLDMENLLPDVLLRWYIVVSAVSLYNVFDGAFRLSLIAFGVGYHSGF